MKLHYMLAAYVGLSTLAIAQDVAIEDSDGDGVYSMVEMQTVYPDLTVETFAEIDANEDGVVDPEELAVATAAGLLGS